MPSGKLFRTRVGRNLERDPKAARDIVCKTGQTGVPVIKTGSRWNVGFDKKRIEKELGSG